MGDNQFEFDYTRQALGAGDRELINIDAIDPGFFSLDMFGADDLLNQGSNYVSYGGYDPYGTRRPVAPPLKTFSMTPVE